MGHGLTPGKTGIGWCTEKTAAPQATVWPAGSMGGWLCSIKSGPGAVSR
ncbi:hypothetical protein C4K05_2485 [Pseudomonas chlororaphis subsp. aureofaciens]|nr:hypothetical protein C4K19_2430 [Pseudomonas chlororaphis subsp. aurantiaca]AZD72737.1 hypothetical protein C4K16_2377 [Pseudomonas chlororaphis subsp. aurantiaca]AZE41825.1 hypothetical protein C4K05_2485 [Pseudomonas chlororaphis subsp. aureofaciens]